MIKYFSRVEPGHSELKPDAPSAREPSHSSGPRLTTSQSPMHRPVESSPSNRPHRPPRAKAWCSSANQEPKDQADLPRTDRGKGSGDTFCGCRPTCATLAHRQAPLFLIDSVHVMALPVGLVAHLDPQAPQGPGTTTLK
eukprot:SAG11_NODE_6636_length_1275_cov_4.180272_1_plen_138_part_01